MQQCNRITVENALIYFYRAIITGLDSGGPFNSLFNTSTCITTLLDNESEGPLLPKLMIISTNIYIVDSIQNQGMQ